MKKAVALKYPEGAPSPFVTASARGEKGLSKLQKSRVSPSLKTRISPMF